MKKTVSSVLHKSLAVLACGAMVAGLAGCGSSTTDTSSEEVPTVTLWSSGGQEVGDALQAIADEFNSDPEYSKHAKMEIQFITSGTNEQSLTDRLVAAYEAGETDTDFDIVAYDDTYISTIIAQTSDDFFETIDTSKLENYDNLIYTENVVGDTFIPYRATNIMLAYNSDNVKDVPETADELYQWIHDNPGKFTYCDPTTGGSGLSFLLTSIYNQLPEEAATSSDEKWETEHQTEWDNAINLLKELHPDLYQTSGSVQYPVKNQGSLDLLANGQIDMTPAFVNMVLAQKNMGTLPDSIEMTQIDPAFGGALAGLLIPSIAKDKEAAYYVIDYMLSYEAQAIDWNQMYASPVVDSSKLEGIDHPEWLEATEADSLRYFSVGTLQVDAQTRWTEEVGILAQ